MAAYKFMIIQILLHHQALNYVTILTVFPDHSGRIAELGTYKRLLNTANW